MPGIFAFLPILCIFAHHMKPAIIEDILLQTPRLTTVTTIPTQGQILVNIEDMSMLKDIKKAISMVKGVGKITIPRSKRLSSYERSLRDLDEGRVFEYDSLDDLIKEIEG